MPDLWSASCHQPVKVKTTKVLVLYLHSTCDTFSMNTVKQPQKTKDIGRMSKDAQNAMPKTKLSSFNEPHN